MNKFLQWMLIAPAILFSPAINQPEDLAQWRGPERNGTYPEKNLLTSWPERGPQLLWSYDGLGSGFSSAVVTSDRVHTTGTIDSISYVFCFDINGALAWKKPLGPDFMGEYPGIYSTPVISGEMGYVVTSLGVLYCFSSVNGDILWSKDLIKEFNGPKKTSGFLDNLIVDGDVLYCAPGGAGKNIVALNRRNGSLIWASSGEQEITGYGSPILVNHKGRKYYIYQDAGSILALNAADGTPAWRHPRTSPTTVGTPLYHNGYLFTLNEQGSILLKLAEGNTPPEIVWTHPDFFPLEGDPVLIGSRLYGKSQGKKYYSVDWLTGQTIGSIPVKSMVVTTVAADGLIFAYDIDGIFSLIKPVESGLQTVGSFKVEGGTKFHCSHPAIKNGRLYIRHDNSLFVYNISKEAGNITSPRPIPK
ncbi:MAG: PQQ-binding-like beta-propeller repeat protein [Bacteroidales bacterium]|jgi:outer membrane protein assembly factor BamB